MTNLQNQIKVEKTELKLIRLSEMIDRYDIEEDFKEEVHDVETFEYTSQTQFITLVCDYNYKEELFNLYIFSTHDDLNLEYKNSFKTFNEAENFVVKHSNEINFILKNF